MRLNRASDFALRILLLLGKLDDPISVDGIATTLGLAKSNVMKIVAKLSAAGLVTTQRGPKGGVTLGQSADRIRVGQVVRTIENDLAVVDCLNEGPCSCIYVPRCALKPAILAATEAFFECLDDYTLASLLTGTRTPVLQEVTA